MEKLEEEVDKETDSKLVRVKKNLFEKGYELGKKEKMILSRMGLDEEVIANLSESLAFSFISGYTRGINDTNDEIKYMPPQQKEKKEYVPSHLYL